MPAPIITSVEPAHGNAGSTVTIRGRYFVQGATSVTIKGVAATVLYDTPREIIVEVPGIPAGMAPVVVATVDGSKQADTQYTVEEPQKPPSAVGRVMGMPALARAMQQVLPFALTGGVVAASASVRGSAGYSSNAAGNVGDAMHGLINDAIGIGGRIGGALLEGVLRPFGASGQAVQQLGSAVGKAVTSVFDMALNGVTNLLKAGGKIAGGAMGLAGAAGGALIGGAVGGVASIGLAGAGIIPGALIGAAVGSALALAVSKVLSAVSDVFGAITAAVGKLAGIVGETLVSAIRSVTVVVQDVTQAAMEMSKAALGIHQQSGLSMGAAAQATMTGLGFGLRPGDVAGAFGSQNTLYQTGVAGAYGIGGEPGTDEHLSGARRRYQDLLRQGGGNPLMANQMAQTLGMGAYIPAFNLSDSQFGRQMQAGQAMQSAFGMSPDRMAKAQQDLGMLMNSLGQFVELLKTKVFDELMPYMTAGLDKAIGFVKDHSQDIAKWIKVGVEKGVEYALIFASFLTEKFPLMVIEGLQFVLKGASMVAKAVPVLWDVAKKWFDDIWAKAKEVGAGIKSFVDTMGTMLGPLKTLIEWATGKKLPDAPGKDGKPGAPDHADGTAMPGSNLPWWAKAAIPGVALGIGGGMAGAALRGGAGLLGRGVMALASQPLAWATAAGTVIGAGAYHYLGGRAVSRWIHGEDGGSGAFDAAGNAMQRIGAGIKGAGWMAWNPVALATSMYRHYNDPAIALTAQHAAMRRAAAGGGAAAAGMPAGTQPGADGSNPILNAFGVATPAGGGSNAASNAVDGWLKGLEDLKGSVKGHAQSNKDLMDSIRNLLRAYETQTGQKVDVNIKVKTEEGFVAEITKQVMEATAQDAAIAATTS